MTVHLSARLSWHMDGWNGSVCRKPAANNFCIGQHSYPGDKIKSNRDLDWERSKEVAGKPCSSLNRIPPCIYSINAFGPDRLTVCDDPPDFFKTGSRTSWELPAASVCTWPYEAMYSDEAKTPDGKVDNDKRLVLAKEYFAAIEPGKSLVFHYANLSNPLSTDETRQYVVVGLSRVKGLGETSSTSKILMKRRSDSSVERTSGRKISKPIIPIRACGFPTIAIWAIGTI